MKSTTAFQKILRTEFGYDSPPHRGISFKLLPAWAATAVYYARLMDLIYGSSKIAEKGHYDRDRWIFDSSRVFGFVEGVGGKIHVSGLRRIAEHPGPLVFISNHMSMLDTFLLPALILPFHRVTYVIKESLLRYPVFGAIMRAVRPIALTRKNPRQDLKVVLEEGQRLLRHGCSVIIFPQSTRSVRFDSGAFNSLGVKLAKKAGVFAVPTALKTDFQQNGHAIKEMGRIVPANHVHIKFGRPLPVTGNGSTVHRQTIQFIEENLAQWGGTLGS